MSCSHSRSSLRLGGAHDSGFWIFLIGYLVISVGAYIGGHVVFGYGYMVNRSAFARGKRRRLHADPAAAELPEATPTKASFGATTLVLVRRGDVVSALKETCSHAGGPLRKGRCTATPSCVPGTIQPSASSDGAVRHGPATSRQVAYRARISDGQVEIQGPMD